MTAGQRRYAEMIAIRLAVEILTGTRHRGHDSYVTAARHLGAGGATRQQALTDLVRLIGLHTGRCYRPTRTVQRALTTHYHGAHR